MNDGKSTGNVFLIGAGPGDPGLLTIKAARAIGAVNVNIRRIGFVARLLARNGVAVLGAAIPPYQRSRDDVMPSIEADSNLSLNQLTLSGQRR